MMCSFWKIAHKSYLFPSTAGMASTEDEDDMPYDTYTQTLASEDPKPPENTATSDEKEEEEEEEEEEKEEEEDVKEVTPEETEDTEENTVTNVVR